MHMGAVSAALTASLLLCTLQACTHQCTDPTAALWFKPAWQERKFYRAWDWPFVLTVLEFCAYYSGYRSPELHSLVLGVRVAAQVAVCAHHDCPSGAFSNLTCGHGNCCGAYAKPAVWAAPDRMCPLPPNYVRECAPLLSLPHLTRCDVWGCSSTATPLSWFTMWQTGASAFAAVWYAFVVKAA
jgi:hypothetical protein